MTDLPEDLADLHRKLSCIITKIDDGEYITRQDVIDDVLQVAGGLQPLQRMLTLNQEFQIQPSKS